MKRSLTLLATVLAFLSTGCFEDPVSEEVVLRFGEGPEVEATARVSIGIGRPESGALARRLGDLREAFERGVDPWTRRFERVEAQREERTLVHSRDGRFRKLAEVRHSALFPAENLPLFLGGSNLTISSIANANERQLLIVPGSTGSATAAARASVERELRLWSELVAVYLAEADALFAYLEIAPERAEHVFRNLFADVTGEEDVEAAYPLSEEEIEILEALFGAMHAVADAAASTGGEAWNFNERSLEVYDPFPASVLVCVEGDVLEVEGFRDAGEECFDVPRRGVLDSLLLLDGRWIDPDPLSAWLEAHRDSERAAIDPAAFAAMPRLRRGAPTPGAVRVAVEELMRHEPSYRLRWRLR
jgi:hypothetical protein